MWWKILLFPLVVITIFAVFYLPPPQSQLVENIDGTYTVQYEHISRIIFFHVPVAWVTVLAFFISMINSVKYLQKKDLSYDTKAVSSARLGFIFCLLAAISGAIWAKATWGSFWNWDPRETTIFILLLIYGAYFSLRSAVNPEQRKAALSSVYSIIAFVTVPFLVFVIPRAYQSLHPNVSIINQKLEFQMPPIVLALFILCLLNMTLIFTWIYSIEIKVSKLDKNKQKEQNVS